MLKVATRKVKEMAVLKTDAKSVVSVVQETSADHADHVTVRITQKVDKARVAKATRMDKKVVDHPDDVSTANQKPAEAIK